MSNLNDGSALISLEGLTKPATVLIERIADAVGTLYRPRQIIRVAHAEAEADKIRALAGVEISEIQQRGLVRFVEQQGREQKNIEDITAQAVEDLSDEAKPEDIEEDWLANFFDKCKHVSDKEMQSLWGKLLAGEANQPKTFSKRTVEFVSTLDKSDAQLFTLLCTFVWDAIRPIASLTVPFYLNALSLPLIYKLNDEFFVSQDLSIREVFHLEDIGLIKYNPLGLESINLPNQVAIRYYGTPLCIQFKNETDNKFRTGHVTLTKVGIELAPICGSVRNDAVMDHVVGNWIEHGYKVSSPYPRVMLKGGSSTDSLALPLVSFVATSHWASTRLY